MLSPIEENVQVCEDTSISKELSVEFIQGLVDEVLLGFDALDYGFQSSQRSIHAEGIFFLYFAQVLA